MVSSRLGSREVQGENGNLMPGRKKKKSYASLQRLMKSSKGQKTNLIAFPLGKFRTLRL